MPMTEDQLLQLLTASSMNQGPYATSNVVPGGFVNQNFTPDYLQMAADAHAQAMGQAGGGYSSRGGGDINGYPPGGGGGYGGGGSLASLAAGSGQNNYAQQAADAAAQRALQLQIAQMGNAIDQGRLNLDTQLGQGNLQIGQNRLALDDLLGKRSQQLQASEQFGQRATRQLVAPGGKVNPTIAPIVGRSQI